MTCAAWNAAVHVTGHSAGASTASLEASLRANTHVLPQSNGGTDDGVASSELDADAVVVEALLPRLPAGWLLAVLRAWATVVVVKGAVLGVTALLLPVV